MGRKCMCMCSWMYACMFTFPELAKRTDALTLLVAYLLLLLLVACKLQMIFVDV